MATASINGIKFPFNPDAVSWGFNTKTAVKYTVGGKVVQVLGSSIGSMTITGSYGKGGFESQKKFVDKLSELAEKQKNQVPLSFRFPDRGWDFDVFITSIATPDGGRSASVRSDLPNPKWQIVLSVVRENANLKKAASNKYISRLTRGIGWRVSEYNGGVAGLSSTDVGVPSGSSSGSD